MIRTRHMGHLTDSIWPELLSRNAVLNLARQRWAVLAEPWDVSAAQSSGNSHCHQPRMPCRGLLSPSPAASFYPP